MTTALAPATTMDASIVERVLIHGDLRQLTPAQKVSYYSAVCESVGLNPLTRPFEYIVLNGKETFYAKRDATDQLRKVHQVSVQIVAREVTEDCYVVTARATMPNGRQDESIGAVPIAALKGEMRANAMMKCETKAKRRVTLSICGLGMLDETEIESIQATNGNSTYVVEAPMVQMTPAATPAAPLVPSEPNGGDSAIPDLSADLPAGYVRIRRVEGPNGKAKGFLHTHDMPPGNEKGLAMYDERLVALASECAMELAPVKLDYKTSAASGNRYVTGITRYAPQPMVPAEPMTADEIPF